MGDFFPAPLLVASRLQTMRKIKIGGFHNLAKGHCWGLETLMAVIQSCDWNLRNYLLVSRRGLAETGSSRASPHAVFGLSFLTLSAADEPPLGTTSRGPLDISLLGNDIGFP